MVTAVALPLVLLGVLIVLGTLEEIWVAPLMRRYTVPTCCSKRVDAFESRARWILAGGSAALLSGLVLLLV